MLSSLKLPLYLEPVKAGFPSPASDYSENALDFNELLVRNKPASFCLRVSGDSMRNAGIFPGDILLADRSLKPVHRDIVVAAVEGEFTLKRLLFSAGGGIVLHPENPLYPDLELHSGEELEIFGVVRAVIRQLKP